MHSPHSWRQRARRVLLALVVDLLLLPLAVLVVLVDDFLWQATKILLRRLERIDWLRRAQAWIGRLPAVALLPLFLLTEATSHAAGFAGAFLFAKGQMAVALLLLVLVKGLATLAVVWIYQGASATLLAVPWFAAAHHAVGFVLDWSRSQLRHLRDLLRARLRQSGFLLRRVAWRFRVLRLRLAGWLSRLRFLL